jgi:XRE family transcriptional regulator, master regulator for biofilm formation
MDKIGKNLKELRAAEGLSLRELGEKLDISYNTIASYERDIIIPTITNVIKICNYFNVPAEYLIYGKKVKTDFNDAELLSMFREVDEYGKENKTLVKKMLKKLINNIKEREDLLKG